MCVTFDSLILGQKKLIFLRSFACTKRDGRIDSTGPTITQKGKLWLCKRIHVIPCQVVYIKYKMVESI
jgi:hypothetical protein